MVSVEFGTIQSIKQKSIKQNMNNPIPCVKNLVAVVNNKKKELENISKELYKMVAEDFVQFKGKKVTVVWLTGMNVGGMDVTYTTKGTLVSVSTTGQNFVVKDEKTGVNTHIKILNMVDMVVE